MHSLWRTVVMTSFPVDVRPFHDDTTSFPVFPYYRPPLPVTSGLHDVISGR